MAAQQMVTRRVYDDAGNLIRSDLAPKDLPNERQALLAYWAEQDAAAADAAAAEAELAGMAQAPGGDDVLALAALQEAVAEHSDILDALDSRTSTLVAAQPQEVLRAATQLQLAAGAAQAVEATGQQVQQRIDAVAQAAEARLASLDQQVAASVTELGDAVSGARQITELAAAAIKADAAKQVAKLVSTTTARVADLRGPKGATGNPGAATTIGAGTPEGPGVMEPLLGRGAVLGDIFIDGSDDNRRAYRWDGEQWEPGPSMLSTKLVDAKISSLSTGNTVFPTAAGAPIGGGGGGAADKISLLTGGTIAANTSVMIADSSRWQVGGNGMFQSGRLSLEFQSVAPAPFAGATNALVVDFILTAGGADPFRFTESAALGDLLRGSPPTVDVKISGTVAAPVVPAVVGGAVPPGTAQASFLYVEFASASANRFVITGGSVLWNLDVSTGAALTSAIALKQPSWQLI